MGEAISEVEAVVGEAAEEAAGEGGEAAEVEAEENPTANLVRLVVLIMPVLMNSK